MTGAQERTLCLETQPDTSSLGAFIVSLLSPSDKKLQQKGFCQGRVEACPSHPLVSPESCTTEGFRPQTPELEGINHGRDPLLQRVQWGTEHFQENVTEHSVPTSTLGSQFEEGPPEDELDEWDKCSTGSAEVGGWEIIEDTAGSQVAMHALELIEPSGLLCSISALQFLCAALPPAMQTSCWKLLYSTDKHESSLRGLYQTTMHRGTANLLVLRDMYGAVFGAFSPFPLAVSSCHQATEECFVFTIDSDGHLHLFPVAEPEGRFIHCNHDSLAFGGSANNFALWIDSDLRNGTSNPCFIFGSGCLASAQNFSVCDVEVWGL
ncbi:hypothetical protein CYMTET_18183 [Cymbomonas tetramitiformis]|uniref:Oxidation resistance protein 1 n=1 Tax=Cymbomonas tetramitiformis TaxID=36881 RepID=A0AAE0G920_9CHLO|nr:hypothetical protein CYMTET_18183 [Cymbomonas tetramitiformis]